MTTIARNRLQSYCLDYPYQKSNGKCFLWKQKTC